MHAYSGKQTVEKQKTTARKRRRNQNVEIDELASLVPLSTPLVSNDNPERSLVPSSGKASAIDKISVLRLTSTFLKLQNFMKESELPECVCFEVSTSVLQSRCRAFSLHDKFVNLGNERHVGVHRLRTCMIR